MKIYEVVLFASLLAVQSGEYKVIGKMLALSIIHGGITPSFFSERLYSLISHCPSPRVDIDEVEDWELRQMIQKVRDKKRKIV